LAALLSACETAGSDSSVAKSGATPQSESIDGTQASPEVAALPPEPEIDDDPERLLGLGPNALSDLLGRPELIRRESPAQVWQYRATDCVFDVVLYREVGSESVTYVEARDGNGDRTEPRLCLHQLLRARLDAAPS
jgi:hypothetical protein